MPLTAVTLTAVTLTAVTLETSVILRAHVFEIGYPQCPCSNGSVALKPHWYPRCEGLPLASAVFGKPTSLRYIIPPPKPPPIPPIPPMMPLDSTSPC
jgi:hypothetical protein